MIVEELVSKLGLEVDSTALATLEKFRSAVTGGLASMGAAAIGVAGAFAGIVGSALHAADAMGDSAEKLGVNVTALQELRVAAVLSDVSFESLATGLKFVAKNAAEAAHGSKEAADGFAGIKLRDANGRLKTADELLMSVAKRFETIRDPAEQTRIAMKLFGRSGIDMIPMLKRGEEGISAFRKEAQELGVVFGEDAIKAGDDFGREMVRVKFAMEGLRNTFAVPFMKLFVEGVRAAVRGIKALRPGVEAMSMAFRDAGERMGGMVGILKRGLEAFSEWFGATALGKLLAQVDAMKVFEAVLIGLGVLLVAVAAKTTIAWAAAAAPFIALAALIGLIVDDLYNFIRGNDSLLGRVIKWARAFDPAGNPVIEFFKSALSLLFDFTDPSKWERFAKAAQTAAMLMNAAFVSALAGIGAALVKHVSQAAIDLVTKFPWLGLLPGVMSGLGLAATGVTAGQRGIENAQARLSGLASFANPFSSAAPSGNAAPSAQSFTPGPTVNQSNNITVNASGLSVEQAKEVVGEALQSTFRQAEAAVSGGSAR